VFGDIYLTSAGVVSLNIKAALSEVNVVSLYGNADLGAVTGLGMLPKLESVLIEQNKLTTLDLSNCSKLKGIRLYGSTELSSVSWPAESALTQIDYRGNTTTKLSSLDLSGQLNLTSLTINGNPALTTLDVSGNSALTGRLDLRNNSLTSLSLPANTEVITELDCSGNKLSFAALPRLLKTQFADLSGTTGTGYNNQNLELPITADGLLVDMSAICPDLSGETVPGTATGGTGYNGYNIKWKAVLSQEWANNIGTSTTVELNELLSYLPLSGGVIPYETNEKGYQFNPELLAIDLTDYELGILSIQDVYAEISHPAYPGTGSVYKTTTATLSNSSVGVESSTSNDPVVDTEYYNLQGQKVNAPQNGAVYVAKNIHASGKVSVKKMILNN
jgi:hypothetical protein